MRMTKSEVKKENPEGFSLGLALVDLLPVLFFGAATVLIGKWLGSVVFIIGATLCVLAGLGKVIWKIIVVSTGKNIKLLSRQLRFLMPTGFLLIIIGCIISRKNKDWSHVISFIWQSPFKFIFLLTIVLMIIMFIMAFKGDGNDARTNWIEEIINTVAQFCFLLGIAYFVFIGKSYSPNSEALEALNNPPAGIIIEKNSKYIAFIPENTNTGLIFYPGGNVDYESYAPLMRGCAEKGILSVIVKMPDNMAIYNADAAEEICLIFPEIDNWIIGGHSLGGAMASSYLQDNYEKYEGLILLGAYAQKDLSNTKLKVLNIYGSEDEVVGMKGYDKYRANLPADQKEIVIEGGCHAFFGSYGSQKGDGSPSIDAVSQQKIAIDAIAEMFMP